MAENNNNNKILVLGGTGHYGRNIVEALLKKNQSVSVLSRNREKVIELFGDKVDIIEGDLTSKDTVKRAIWGVDSIIISISAMSRQLIRRMKQIERDAVLTVFDEANKANINRIIYVSVFERPAADNKIPIAKIKREIEIKLEESDFSYTIFGAAPSIEIFFSMIRGNKMTVPGGGPVALPTVSPLDLGEITAQSVQHPDTFGKRIRLMGPDLFSFREAAEHISEITGEKIQFRKIPLFPFKLAAFATSKIRPLCPYLSELLQFILLLNEFPPSLLTELEDEYNLLQQTFDYSPHTLDFHTRIWYESRKTLS
ncbi:MAG: SDR family oxidoreductase [Candidatus Hodarchaeales archaeon]